MKDINLVEGENRFDIVMEPITVAKAQMLYSRSTHYAELEAKLKSRFNLVGSKQLEAMGFLLPYEVITEDDFGGYLSDPATRMVYVFGHASSVMMKQWDVEFYDNRYRLIGWYIYPDKVDRWLSAREPPLLTFVDGCEAMTRTGSGTFSHAFRKGRTVGTATVGMARFGDFPYWEYPTGFAFWNYIFEGMTFYEAQQRVIANFPEWNGHLIFVGDRTISLADL